MRSTDSVASLVGSALAALAFVWVVYEHILGWSGVARLRRVHLGGLPGLLRRRHARSTIPRRCVRDRLASAVVHSGAAVVASALGYGGRLHRSSRAGRRCTTGTSTPRTCPGCGPTASARPGRHPARDRRVGDRDRHRDVDLAAARPRHRGLPDRGRRPASPAPCAPSSRR